MKVPFFDDTNLVFAYEFVCLTRPENSCALFGSKVKIHKILRLLVIAQAGQR